MQKPEEIINKLSAEGHSFDASLKSASIDGLTSVSIDTLQVNLGYRCNLSCRHCHLEASPERVELMSRKTIEACLRAIKKGDIKVVDITGGAPEMNPDFKWFVSECTSLGCNILVRSNLIITAEDGYKDLPDFFAKNKVEIIASLPFYEESKTDSMRGSGVFKASIKAIKTLNDLGYGRGTFNNNESEAELVLNLVYNPGGAFLPPDEASLGSDFRRELEEKYGISFSNIFALTNMPIGRFFSFLDKTGNLSAYMSRLATSFNPLAAESVMCRTMLSVRWDGSIFDCDFNQALNLKCDSSISNISEFSAEALIGRKIVTGAHCFGCTAGAGSSCGGSVV